MFACCYYVGDVHLAHDSSMTVEVVLMVFVAVHVCVCVCLPWFGLLDWAGLGQIPGTMPADLAVSWKNTRS